MVVQREDAGGRVIYNLLAASSSIDVKTQTSLGVQTNTATEMRSLSVLCGSRTAEAFGAPHPLVPGVQKHRAETWILDRTRISG